MMIFGCYILFRGHVANFDTSPVEVGPIQFFNFFKRFLWPLSFEKINKNPKLGFGGSCHIHHLHICSLIFGKLNLKKKLLNIFLKIKFTKY